ncbi:MAG: hypothetical protein ACKVTZ_16470 [Bacteroidia bacterium]
MREQLEENAIILDALLDFLKTNLSISQKQFCQEIGEEQGKVSHHKKAHSIFDSEKYTDTKAKLEYQQMLIRQVELNYEIAYQKKAITVKSAADLHLYPKEKAPTCLFTVYALSMKGEVEAQAYLEMNLQTQAVISHTYLREEQRFVKLQGEIKNKNGVISLLLEGKEEGFPLHYCLHLGGKSLAHTQLLLGTYSGVNENHAPVCGELLLMKTRNEHDAQSLIYENNEINELGFYLNHKRIETSNKLVKNLHDLPTDAACRELTRVTGNYIAYRLSEEEDAIFSTAVAILANGKVKVKSSVSQVIYHADAHIFLGTLLAITTFTKGEEPYFVQSLFNIGRETRDDLTHLYGVLAGTSKLPVVPRCGREIWVRTNQTFAEIQPRQYLIDSPAYQDFAAQEPEVVQYLRGLPLNVISVLP